MGFAFLCANALFAFLTCCLIFIKKWPQKINHATIWGACLQSYCAIASFSCLLYAYITSDFSISNVLLNSHSLTPLIYRISGAWSNHEGSLLLWLFILNMYLLVFCITHAKKAAADYFLTIKILSTIIFSFSIFIIITSNPFLVIPGASEGLGMNPMLQDPLQAIHPPTLYIGYIGCAVPFSITVAHAFKPTNSMPSLLLAIKYWALWALGWLTAGITLGSIWAYYELGWGGWWFWDPVENASLFPWLACLGLAHLNHIKNKNLFIVFTILPFILSLLATFIVRSGFVSSVHSFASDPSRGFAIILMIIVFTAIAICAMYKILSQKQTNEPDSQITWRQQLMPAFFALLLTIIITLIIATIGPPLWRYYDQSTITLGEDYFNNTIVPIGLIALILMAIIGYNKTQSRSISILLAISLLYFITCNIKSFCDVAIILSLWACLASICSPNLTAKVRLIHCGFAISALSMGLQSKLSQQNITYLKIGETTTIANYVILYKNMTVTTGPNYMCNKARFDVALKSKPHKIIKSLYPEHRAYPVRAILHTETAITMINLTDNLYIALGQEQQNNAWVVRIYYHPFVNCIWLGGAIIFLLIMFTILQRRFSIKLFSYPHWTNRLVQRLRLLR